MAREKRNTKEELKKIETTKAAFADRGVFVRYSILRSEPRVSPMRSSIPSKQATVESLCICHSLPEYRRPLLFKP